MDGLAVLWIVLAIVAFWAGKVSGISRYRDRIRKGGINAFHAFEGTTEHVANQIAHIMEDVGVKQTFESYEDESKIVAVSQALTSLDIGQYSGVIHHHNAQWQEIADRIRSGQPINPSMVEPEPLMTAPAEVTLDEPLDPVNIDPELMDNERGTPLEDTFFRGVSHTFRYTPEGEIVRVETEEGEPKDNDPKPPRDLLKTFKRDLRV